MFLSYSLWLNEGFASYVQKLGADLVEPTYEIVDRTSLTQMHRCFELDALRSSHPISVPVQHPNEIGEIFDAISYLKGSSVIRMMANFLSEKVFNRGVTNYLNKYKYDNAVQDELWESLTEVAHKQKTLDPSITVKEIMDSWTLQMGYPVVNVRIGALFYPYLLGIG